MGTKSGLVKISSAPLKTKAESGLHISFLRDVANWLDYTIFRLSVLMFNCLYCEKASCAS